MVGLESTAARVLSDLRSAQPADPTLQNLLRLLSSKLELCGRLPVFEYEAVQQGHHTSARAFHDLAEVERRSFNELIACLRRHLEETTQQPAPADAGDRRVS
jgi:hypothetical protein